MFCMRLAGNTGCKNDAKNCHLRTVAQLCRVISSQLRHVSTIGKKLVKQQYLLQMSSQYGKLPHTNGWDWFRSLGHPSKFQLVLHLGFDTAPTSLTGGQPNFARSLAISCAGTPYIHFRGLLSPWRNFARCKIHCASKSCVLLYWHCYCMALQQRGQPNFAAWYKEWNCRTVAEGDTYTWLGGHQVGHWPTF